MKMILKVIAAPFVLVLAREHPKVCVNLQTDVR